METLQENQVSADLHPGFHRDYKRGVLHPRANGKARTIDNVSSAHGLPRDAMVGRSARRRVVGMYQRHRITVWYAFVCVTAVVLIQVIKGL